MTGYVYLTEDDLRRAAAFLGLSRRAFESQYVYRTKHLLRLRKPRNSQCHFLGEDGCAIHPAKPTQCRVFPFWPELVGSPAAWRRAGKHCPGIGKGGLRDFRWRSAARQRDARKVPGHVRFPGSLALTSLMLA